MTTAEQKIDNDFSQDDSSTVTDVLDRAIDEHSKLTNFVDICSSGMLLATTATESVDLSRRVASAFRRPDPYEDSAKLDKHRKAAKKIEEFARKEHDHGLPYLYSIATIRVWGILETTVDDVVSTMLRTPDRLPKDSIAAKLQGPLLAFASASPGGTRGATDHLTKRKIPSFVATRSW